MIENGLDRMVVEPAGKIDLFMNSPADLSEPGSHNGMTVGLWFLVGFILLAAFVGVFLWLRHPTKIIEAHTTLQGGKKVDVRLVLEAPWRWTMPERLVKLDVRFDGQDAPVARDAYYGLPIDAGKGLAVFEHAGFPEVIAWGRHGSSITEIRWRFLNYSFSERRILKNKKWEVMHYAGPLPKMEVRKIAPSEAASAESSNPVINSTEKP